MTPRPPASAPLCVLTFPGQALLPSEDAGTDRDQARSAARLGKLIAEVVREGFRVVVLPGAEPHLDRELTRSEAASLVLPDRSVPASLGAIAGATGHRLELAIRNALRSASLHHEVTAVLTHVLVAPADPSLDRPDRPVGPRLSPWRARQLSRGSRPPALRLEPGGEHRRVLGRPRPADIVGLPAIEALLDAGHVVIAGVGGGPTVQVDGRAQLVGVDAWVERPRLAALLAERLGADVLALVGEQEQLLVQRGTPEQQALGATTSEAVRVWLAQGALDAAQRPLAEAAVEFVAGGGERAVIAREDRLIAALYDRSGTRVSTHGGDPDRRRQLALFDPADDTDDADALPQPAAGRFPAADADGPPPGDAARLPTDPDADGVDGERAEDAPGDADVPPTRGGGDGPTFH